MKASGLSLLGPVLACHTMNFGRDTSMFKFAGPLTSRSRIACGLSASIALSACSSSLSSGGLTDGDASHDARDAGHAAEAAADARTTSDGSLLDHHVSDASDDKLADSAADQFSS